MLVIVSLRGVRVYNLALDPENPILIFSTLETYLRDAEVQEIQPGKGNNFLHTSHGFRI